MLVVELPSRVAVYAFAAGAVEVIRLHFQVLFIKFVGVGVGKTTRWSQLQKSGPTNLFDPEAPSDPQASIRLLTPRTF